MRVQRSAPSGLEMVRVPIGPFSGSATRQRQGGRQSRETSVSGKKSQWVMAVKHAARLPCAGALRVHRATETHVRAFIPMQVHLLPHHWVAG